MVVDVSPLCDCAGTNDIPVISDIGMFASFDPVALDQACVDAANAAPIVPNSAADRPHHHDHHDLFTNIHPDTEWEAGLDHAEKIGIGSREYELVVVK